MSLIARIEEELKAARLARDADRRDALSLVLHALRAAQKELQRPLSDDEELQVLQRERKRRLEAAEAFRAGGREDLATKEEAEIAILTTYLPQALTEPEIVELIREGIAATGAGSARDMGKVMGWLAPRTRGRADGKRVSELVAQALAGADLAAHDGGTP